MQQNVFKVTNDISLDAAQSYNPKNLIISITMKISKCICLVYSYSYMRGPNLNIDVCNNVKNCVFRNILFTLVNLVSFHDIFSYCVTKYNCLALIFPEKSSFWFYDHMQPCKSVLLCNVCGTQNFIMCVLWTRDSLGVEEDYLLPYAILAI